MFDNFVIEQKARNAEIFRETLEICKAGEYVTTSSLSVKLPPITDVLAASKWYESPLTVDEVAISSESSVSVVNKDCILVAQELVEHGYNPVMLNMASRSNPGGGVITGARAQEETLCRRSNLCVSLYHYSAEHARMLGLPCADEMYPMNRETGAIYSGRVMFFRTGVNDGYRLMDKPFETAVVSVAAINRPDIDGNGRLAEWAIAATKQKMRSMLRVGLLNGHDAIVLGAFGCGAFHNPPKHIAELYREVLNEVEFKNKYRIVRFAIIEDHNSHNRNFVAFDKVFGGQAASGRIDSVRKLSHDRRERGCKNELWLGDDNSGVRFALRKFKNGQLRVEACAISYPGEHALLTADECKRCITSIERDSDDELRLHPEGFGCLSFDVSNSGLGIDHHRLYDWTYQERQCLVEFLKMCVAKMEI